MEGSSGPGFHRTLPTGWGAFAVYIMLLPPAPPLMLTTGLTAVTEFWHTALSPCLKLYLGKQRELDYAYPPPPPVRWGN